MATFEKLICVVWLLAGVYLAPVAYASLDGHSITNSVVQEKIAVFLDRDGYVAVY